MVCVKYSEQSDTLICSRLSSSETRLPITLLLVDVVNSCYNRSGIILIQLSLYALEYIRK